MVLNEIFASYWLLLFSIIDFDDAQLRFQMLRQLSIIEQNLFLNEIGHLTQSGK
jgi:hypothetical protein